MKKIEFYAVAAKLETTCLSCGNSISPGENIACHCSAWVHADCFIRFKETPKTRVLQLMQEAGKARRTAYKEYSYMDKLNNLIKTLEENNGRYNNKV